MRSGWQRHALTQCRHHVLNAEYRVVVPRDAVAGVPSDYADAVIANTLSLLATLTTADAPIDTWK
jgi:hypothetical protein